VEQRISESSHRFLETESSRWVEDGFISVDQRDSILGGYVVVRRIPTVVLTLGVLMIGLGLLSFIAANWQELSAWLKVSLIIVSYLVCVIAACMFEWRGGRFISGSLMFLSGFILLGGMALISQVFHIQVEVFELLGVWLLVYIPTLLLVKSLPVYILYEVAAIIYMNIKYTETGAWWGYERSEALFDTTTLFQPLQPLLLLILLTALAWHVWSVDSKVSAIGSSGVKKFFIGGSTRRIFLCNFFILNWFVWICLLNSHDNSALPFVFGVIALGVLISLLGWRLDSSELDWQGLLFIGASGLALTFPFIWDSSYLYSSYHGYDALSSLSAPIISSVCLSAYLVSRIIRGKRGGGFSVFLFCVVLMRWYFDMLGSLMQKSLLFVSGGVFLIMVAFAYNRWSKKRRSGVVDE
jgi:uncharacterized membrane protein